jgi:hypothetical protein
MGVRHPCSGRLTPICTGRSADPKLGVQSPCPRTACDGIVPWRSFRISRTEEADDECRHVAGNRSVPDRAGRPSTKGRPAGPHCHGVVNPQSSPRGRLCAAHVLTQFPAQIWGLVTHVWTGPPMAACPRAQLSDRQTPGRPARQLVVRGHASTGADADPIRAGLGRVRGAQHLLPTERACRRSRPCRDRCHRRPHVRWGGRDSGWVRY